MRVFIHKFRSNEDGAITVDWVLLTAAVVGLGAAVLMNVGTATVNASSNVSADIKVIEPVEF